MAGCCGVFISGVTSIFESCLSGVNLPFEEIGTDICIASSLSVVGVVVSEFLVCCLLGDIDGVSVL